jgi:Tol biopolymer transport system component/DNA-binding winged helix-turn-helix (wHTH) protein
MASPDSTQGTIRFGQFEVDPASRELRKNGRLVKVQRQHFAVLLLLVERAGQVVSREEIHQHIWGNDTFVDFERGINLSINQIRAALGDDAEKPRFIETIPRWGYRFIANVENREQRGAAASITPILGNRESIASGDQEQVNPPPDIRVAVRPLSAKRILISCLTALTAVGAGFLLLRSWHSGARSAQTHTGTAIVRTFPLTTFPGEFQGIALSPDASQVAFTWNGPNFAKWDIYVQRIEGDRPLQITHTQSGMITGIDWSPDGRLLVFGRCDQENRGALYTIPPLGGPEHKLTDVACVWGDATAIWTPDSRSLVFSDSCTPGGSLGIAAFELETGQKRCLASPASNAVDFLNPMVSPDGNNVAFVSQSTIRVMDISTVPFRGGSVRRLTYEGKRIGQLVWSRDGQSIVFASHREGIRGNKIWKVSVKGGPIEAATDPLLAMVSPEQRPLSTVSRDGRRIAYVDEQVDKFLILRAHLSSAGGQALSQEKIMESPKAVDSPQLSADGKHITFASSLSGAPNIWNSDVDGLNALQLTSFGGERVGSSHWSPDGRWIVFDRRPSDHAQIYVIDAEGRNMHAITEGDYENNVPDWSRDGKSIYFSSKRTGRMELWKQDLGSGVAAQVTQHGGFSAVESYDGKYLYYVKFFSPGIWRMPIGGGEEQRITDQPDAWFWAYWDITDTGLYFFDVSALPRPEIKFYDSRTHQITPVLQADGQARYWTPGISASRDGRTLFYPMQYANSTIMIAENLQ